MVEDKRNLTMKHENDHQQLLFVVFFGIKILFFMLHKSSKNKMSAFRFCKEEKASLIASEDERMHFRVCMSTLGVARSHSFPKNGNAT